MKNKVLEEELRKFFREWYPDEIDEAITMVNFIHHNMTQHFSEECFNESKMLSETAVKLRNGIKKAHELLKILEAHA